MASSAASRPLGELGPSAEPAGALMASFKGATEASPEVGPAFHALALPSLSSSPCVTAAQGDDRDEFGATPQAKPPCTRDGIEANYCPRRGHQNAAAC